MNGQPPADPSGPRAADRGTLGIRHLLVWTACSAVYLAVSRVAYPWEDADFARYYTGFSAAASLSAGAGLAGLFLLAACLFRRVRFPAHPGEVLLVVSGLQTVTDLIDMGHRILLQRGGRWIDIPLSSSMLLGILIGLIACIWLLVAAIRTPSRQWKVLFVLLLLGPILFLTEQMILVRWPLTATVVVIFRRVLPITRTILKAVFLGLVAVAEWRREPRRPWAHWAGVLCVAWETTLQLVWLVMVLCFSSD